MGHSFIHLTVFLKTDARKGEEKKCKAREGKVRKGLGVRCAEFQHHLMVHNRPYSNALQLMEVVSMVRSIAGLIT